jgi:hypothetical protein
MKPEEIARIITEDPDVLTEDEPCPECGGQAYIGFSTIECPTPGCRHYSQKQEEIVKKQEEIANPPELNLSLHAMDWPKFRETIENTQYELDDFDSGLFKTIPLFTTGPAPAAKELSTEFEDKLGRRIYNETDIIGEHEYETGTQPTGYYGTSNEISFNIYWNKAEIDEMYIDEVMQDGRIKINVTFTIPYHTKGWRKTSVMRP